MELEERITRRRQHAPKSPERLKTARDLLGKWEQRNDRQDLFSAIASLIRWAETK